jgi:hypothetical protein
VVHGTEPPTDGGYSYPDCYGVEIREDASRVGAVQRFVSRVRPDLRAELSPSGKKVVPTWMRKPPSNCQKESGFGMCDRGFVIDLAEKVR